MLLYMFYEDLNYKKYLIELEKDLIYISNLKISAKLILIHWFFISNY